MHFEAVAKPSSGVKCQLTELVELSETVGINVMLELKSVSWGQGKDLEWWNSTNSAVFHLLWALNLQGIKFKKERKKTQKATKPPNTTDRAAIRNSFADGIK